MDAIRGALDAVTVGDPLTAGRLTMVPLLCRSRAAVDYVTLDEALGSGAFHISEKGEGGSVPELLVLNDLEQSVLLLDGEELVGAKQNRIINITVLVPGKKTVQLPVSCVEAGRWHHRTRNFGSAPRAYYATGRAMKARDVNVSYRSSGRPSSDQGAIWEDIAAKSARFEVHSDTSAMDVMYERSSLALEELEARFRPLPNQVGAAFLIAGTPIGLDLFESPETWRKLSPKLIASYGLDAVDSRPGDSRAGDSRAGESRAGDSRAGESRAGDSRGGNPVARDEGWVSGDEGPAAGDEGRVSRDEGWVSRDEGRVSRATRALLARVVEMQQERYASAGLGEDVRLSGGELAGGALVVGERLVHLAVFAG